MPNLRSEGRPHEIPKPLAFHARMRELAKVIQNGKTEAERVDAKQQLDMQKLQLERRVTELTSTLEAGGPIKKGAPQQLARVKELLAHVNRMLGLPEGHVEKNPSITTRALLLLGEIAKYASADLHDEHAERVLHSCKIEAETLYAEAVRLEEYGTNTQEGQRYVLQALTQVNVALGYPNHDVSLTSQNN